MQLRANVSIFQRCQIASGNASTFLLRRAAGSPLGEGHSSRLRAALVCSLALLLSGCGATEYLAANYDRELSVATGADGQPRVAYTVRSRPPVNLRQPVAEVPDYKGVRR